MVAANLELNGISSVIMNYCRNINLEKFEITLFVGKQVNRKFAEECKNLEIKVIELPSKKKSKFKYYISLLRTVKRNKYDIIHVHGNSAVMFLELFIGYIKGIKNRIAHSHNTICENSKIHKCLFPFFRKIYTNAFSCGELAGNWIFGENNFEIISNGINVEKFKFDANIRKLVRDELKINDNEILLGHIGRINKQKNQEFLISIFESIAEREKNIKLLMVGTGPEYENIKKIVDKSKFKDRIILYGESNEAEKFYMAMDVFVFPSKYEGLPLTLLEAQISGLECVMSDVITSEVILTNCVETISLEEAADKWGKKIKLKMKNHDRKAFFYNNLDNIEKFNIRNCVKELENKYFNMLK